MWRKLVVVAVLFALGPSADGVQMVIPSSRFQMTLGPASSARVQASVKAVEASIALTLLESSTDGQLTDITAVVEAITESGSTTTRVAASEAQTTRLNFACIGTFQGDHVDTVTLDDFILETFSSLQAIKSFKKLLQFNSQADFGGITTVVVSPLSVSEEDSSSGGGINKLDVILITMSGSILIAILIMLHIHRKEQARQQAIAEEAQRRRRNRRNDRPRSPTDRERENQNKTPIRASVSPQPLDGTPQTAIARDESASSHSHSVEDSGSVVSESDGSLSEAFSKNWFRNTNEPYTSDNDSTDDVFQVGVQDDSAASRHQEQEDQMLGATTLLLDWARYIQVIRSDTKRVGSDGKLSDGKLELEMVSTQSSSTEHPVEEGSLADISLDETSASGSETGTEMEV